MSKYIKSFDSAAELISYFNTAEGKKYYTLMNTAGEEGIGTSISSGKKIISAWKSQYDYLTFTAVEAGATVRYNNLANTTAEYSTDGGVTWNNGVNVTVTLTNIGDSVKYRGVISGNINSTGARFSLSKKISASGSIMSMYNNEPDDTVIVYYGAFMKMFSGCSNLTTAPELPATTLSGNCYYEMFRDCSNLTTAPELPATILDGGCYSYMFRNCSNLTTAPETLPATTLVQGCYLQMFYGCTSLTSAPELPATTLARECYQYMFSGCSSLTTAPELPATTLNNTWYSCYQGIFNNCSNLSSVTHHVTSWNTSLANNWLAGVAASGIVKCPSDSTIPSDSNSGIPSGWTRENL